MALRLQKLFTNLDISLDKNHRGLDNAQNRPLTTQLNHTYNVKCRFALPRSAVSGKGVRLVAISLLYRVTAGTYTSMSPSLSRYTYIDGAVENVAAIPITTPDPAYPAEGFVLTTSSTINRARSAVDTPVYENSAVGESINWLYNVLITPTDVTNELLLYGFEVTYDSVGGGASAANNGGTPSTSNFTADFAKSGFNHMISTTGGSVIVTLPTITTISTGVTFTFTAAADSNNSIQISPDAADSIRGLNLNAAGTDNKDYILAAPAIGNYITIVSGYSGANGIWYVTSAGGTWSREA